MTDNKLSLTQVLADDANRTKNFVAASVLLFVLLSWLGVMDYTATEYVDDAIVQSTVAFASARAVNAAVSVLQSAELSPPVIGGLSMGVGEVLDPINDLVEQYSTLMKMAIGSLVIQKILLQVVSDTFFKVLITFSGGLLLAAIYLRQNLYMNVLARVFISLVFLRFLLAVVVFLNGAISQSFVDQYAEQDLRQLDQVVSDMDSMQSGASNISEEAREGLTQDLENSRELVSDIESRIGELQAQLPGLQSELAEADEQLDAVRSERGFGERFNPFSENEALDQSSEVRDQSLQALEAVQRQIELSEDELEVVSQQIVAIENTLAGRPNSTREAIAQGFSNVSNRAASFGGNLNLAAMQSRLQDSVSTMLNLMAVFLLKTLLMPLLFLYLLLKASRGIWGIDLREVMQRGRDELAARIEAKQ